ncbi:hypothetical protein CKO15_07850 [Halorhodospira abdelmalekii]|uniref:photosynthetic complex putative assembly protein PuhB n=1 Tax=Halorhodospira abdelmalekii TaxID=421629 RepID=UPI0019058654|nr:hypothetical protein [Halorhodospira abdelmalekii]
MREHDFEPILGLPERPPEGEEILWQGKPAWWSFAKRALHVRKVFIFFCLIGAWYAYLAWQEGNSVNYVVMELVGQVVIGLLAAGGLALIGRWMAKNSLYTVTNRRIVMRIGASWQASINLPFTQIEAVDLRKHRDGRSDIMIRIDPRERLSFLFFWPHVRPWRLHRPEPMLRSLPDGGEAVRILSDALQRHLAEQQGSGKRRKDGRGAEPQKSEAPAYANDAR